MPHRDPVFSILARCEQLKSRLEEREDAPLPRRARKALERAARSHRLEDALAAQQTLEAHLAATRPVEDAADLAVEQVVVTTPDCAPSAHPRAARLARRSGWLLAAASFALASGAWLSKAAPPSAASLIYTSAVVTDSHSGQANREDRCTLAISFTAVPSRVDNCDVSIVCPGFERRFHPARCEAPRADAAFQLRDPSLEVDGERGALRLNDVDGHPETSVALRIDRWR
jgi:hypothetical protein